MLVKNQDETLFLGVFLKAKIISNHFKPNGAQY